MRYPTLTLLLAVAATCLAQQPEPPVIHIIHTNDTHSQFEPHQNRDGSQAGGVIERASILELFRLQDPELLYLDSGDMLQGSPYFNIYRGELEVLCMNQQQLLATTFGNHEFDNGVAQLDSILRLADFPMISSNYHCEGTVLEHRVVPHLITWSHDVKIGITGVTCSPQGLIFARHYEGITYEDPVTAVNREAAWLRDEGCDLVIVLSHLGYNATPSPNFNGMHDSRLAAETRGVDLIIGGHSHTNIEKGTVRHNLDGQPVYITQTAGKGNPIGLVDVRMKAGSTYADCQYSVDTIFCSKLNPTDYDLSAYGQGMRELFTPFQESLKDQMGQRLGFAPERLSKSHRQSPLGNLTTDAIRIMGERYTGKHIDASIMNIGGLRSEIPAGDVTLNDLYCVYPFVNYLVVLELRGADLKNLIESNAGRGLDAWSGIQVKLDKEGDRLVARDIQVGGRPIDTDSIYTFCTIDFLAEGNSGMTPLTRALSSQNTGITIRDAMIEYIHDLDAQGLSVSAPLDDRVIDLTQDK